MCTVPMQPPQTTRPAIFSLYQIGKLLGVKSIIWFKNSCIIPYVNVSTTLKYTVPLCNWLLKNGIEITLHPHFDGQGWLNSLVCRVWWSCVICCLARMFVFTLFPGFFTQNSTLKFLSGYGKINNFSRLNKMKLYNDCQSNIAKHVTILDDMNFSAIILGKKLTPNLTHSGGTPVGNPPYWGFAQADN